MRLGPFVGQSLVLMLTSTSRGNQPPISTGSCHLCLAWYCGSPPPPRQPTRQVMHEQGGVPGLRRMSHTKKQKLPRTVERERDCFAPRDGRVEDLAAYQPARVMHLDRVRVLAGRTNTAGRPSAGRVSGGGDGPPSGRLHIRKSPGSGDHREIHEMKSRNP